MQDKKILIIANSIYQLLTAVHMKLSIFKDYKADLIITDITPVSYTHLDYYNLYKKSTLE